MRSLHEVKGIVTQIIPGNKCVVAFSAFGSSQMGVLPGNNLKTVGTVSSDVLLCNLLMVGSKLCFSCHEFGSKADHEYDWYITNAWLINDSSIAGRTPGVFLGLYNCSGKVQKLQNRLGVLCFRDHNETEHLVLFLASKCFIRGKRINAKQSLSTVLSEEDMLLFDAVPCIPEENEFGCDWFATFVWLQGPRPHDYNTSSAPGLSPTSLLLQYKMIASCPRSLFVRGKGQVLKIVNNEYGTALMSVQNNRWDSVLFHRSVCYLFKACLSTQDLNELLLEGDKLSIIAVPAPKSMIAQWIAVQVAVASEVSLDFDS
ncbi:hypothetical protein R5R35_012193 [Gryllus longicercus]|uniref:Uncharacterized protein n=1 Tax=Gryllus longicercus TaxID=2509291 RepID=A0AAN9VVG1_9ORTH|nr:Uncharacterized protein GBIM_05604 [Gryllus bimaculatus]